MSKLLDPDNQKGCVCSVCVYNPNSNPSDVYCWQKNIF